MSSAPQPNLGPVSGIPDFRTEPWDQDFSQGYYFSLVDTLRHGRELHRFSTAAERVLDDGARIGLIRHDIDFSPAQAFGLARDEAERGIPATYFVMAESDEYDIGDHHTASMLRSIATAYDHEIGLHYNPSAWKRHNVTDVRDLEGDITAQATILEQAIGVPVGAVSFHRPGANKPTWLDGPLRLAGLVNAYASLFMSPAESALYATDSAGVWAFGEPHYRIQNAHIAGAHVIQLLTHAEWWNETKDGNMEVLLEGRGAGAIFHIHDTDEFMFFLRDDKDAIPFPNMIDIIGGHLEDGETPQEAAMREFGEELDDLDTGEPFQPEGLAHFKTWVDERNVEQNIFGCELETSPNLRLKEGQRLVFLKRQELADTEFAFHYSDVVREYAQTV